MHDFYRQVFVECHSDSSSWPFRSRKLLGRYGLADFYGSGGAGSDLTAYFKYVRDHLVARCRNQWAPDLAKHVLPFPYQMVMRSGRWSMSAAGKAACTWEELLGIRSWCRLRAGLIRLTHRFHRRSAAKIQQCIFCNDSVSDGYAHVFSSCPEWSACRIQPLQDEMGAQTREDVPVAAVVLRVGPGSRLWRSVLRWSHRIDLECVSFWQQPPPTD